MTQTPDRPAGAVTAEEIRKPLAAYRALAWATGIWLIALCYEIYVRYVLKVDNPPTWIGIVHGCDGCIASHARGAVRAGASKQEAADAIGVAIMMHGGPGTVYGARAFAAFCEFADAAEG